MKQTLVALGIALILIAGSGLLVLMPDVAYAQGGIVPCGGPGQPSCNICHLTKLAENVIEFIVKMAFVIAALLFAAAGFLFFTAGANEGNVTKARSIFTNVLVGIIIILTAWLVIDILLQTLTGQGVNPFTRILCS